MSNNQEKLDKLFEKFTITAKLLPMTTTNEDKLYLYGYYKQATQGDCNIEKPKSLFDQKSLKKWEYWEQHKGLNSNEAKKYYIKKVQSLMNS